MDLLTDRMLEVAMSDLQKRIAFVKRKTKCPNAHEFLDECEGCMTKIQSSAVGGDWDQASTSAYDLEELIDSHGHYLINLLRTDRSIDQAHKCRAQALATLDDLHRVLAFESLGLARKPQEAISCRSAKTPKRKPKPRAPRTSR